VDGAWLKVDAVSHLKPAKVDAPMSKVDTTHNLHSSQYATVKLSQNNPEARIINAFQVCIVGLRVAVAVVV